MARDDYYGAAHCGGALLKSGKGSRPGRGEGQRHQKVLAFSAWHKKGCDVYSSSRWTGTSQIYDHYWTPKNMAEWSWKTREWEWVYPQELPLDKKTEDFVWDDAKNTTSKKLNKKRYQQKAKFFEGR